MPLTLGKRHHVGHLALTLFLALGVAVPARAEVLHLLDNTQVAGKILHYYDGVFDVEVAGGQHMKIARETVKSITFQLPPARPEYSTPEKTFHRWQEAIAKNDLEKLVDCYALMYQGLIHAQLSEGDAFAQMRKEIEGTKFDLKGTKTTGTNATLKVQQQKGDDVKTADLHFVLENGEWKMTP